MTAPPPPRARHRIDRNASRRARMRIAAALLLCYRYVASCIMTTQLATTMPFSSCIATLQYEVDSLGHATFVPQSVVVIVLHSRYAYQQIR
mmetsp:Transcript_13790/g.26297  ORF Transcript_13790/g.26297 Transcript_13790/m.26297 type:complete len:91 (+) Transcript_13790:39-311(+)